MAPTSKSTQYGIRRVSVVAYILLEIWVSRCSATFEGKPMKARAILQVFRQVQLINLTRAPTRRLSILQENLLEVMGINRAPIRRKIGLWCKWDKSSTGWFKLNVDG